MKFTSKLPLEQESIFNTMAKLARKHSAVDLSQGFPNFSSDQKLKELVDTAIFKGYNQYAPMAGVPELLEKISEKIEKLYGHKYDINTEITITSGATQALYSAITAFVNKGDEVIVFKPSYDSYEPTIKLNGGVPVLLELNPENFSIDFEQVKSNITSKTRMIILNTPHNPSGKVLSKTEMLTLQEILNKTDIILLSDEVYEHLIYDGKKHYSASQFPGLAARSIICASFGKTFHNTGWKIGYCAAPSPLMKEIRKVHQQTVFCVNHPIQVAFAEYLKNPQHYLYLNDFYQEKRDRFLNLIKGSKFTGKPAQGTYFQVLNYSEITQESDVQFAKRLVKDYKLAAIPISVFNKGQKDNKQLRFCFAKTPETLQQAAEILNKLSV